MSTPANFAQMAEWMVAANAKIDRLESWLARSTASVGQLRLTVSDVVVNVDVVLNVVVAGGRSTSCDQVSP